MVRALIKHAVKPAEEAFFAFAVVAFGDRLQHGGTEGWRQDQRNDNRQHHRRNDSNRELAVDRTGRATEEGHRDKYRGQHQGNTHQRALNLPHRFPRGLFRREPLFGHNTFDVLYHHDGVINQQADCQHHTKHGEGVYRVAEGGEDGEGTQQYHRNGNRWDQRCTEVLQEQVHYQEHQHNRFDQRFHHFVNGDFNERRGVVRVDHLQACREGWLQGLNSRTYGIGGIQRVSAGRQFDPQTRGWLTIVLSDNVVVLAAQLNLCYVTQANLGAIRVYLQQDLTKLFRRGESGLSDNRGVQLLSFHRRRAAELTCCYLGVLRLNSVDDINRRKLEVVQLVRIHPDSHRVLGTEQLHVTDTRSTANRIFHRRAYVVSDIFLGHRTIGVDHPQHHQEAAG